MLRTNWILGMVDNKTLIKKTSTGKPKVQPRAATTIAEDPQIQGLSLTKGEYEKLIKMIRDTKKTIQLPL